MTGVQTCALPICQCVCLRAQPSLGHIGSCTCRTQTGIDDGGTQTLMSAFYTQLLTSDVTKAEALRQAQLTLINQSNSAQSAPRGVTLVSQDGETEPEIWNRLSHPYYWSPFILIGNGR